MDSTVSKQVALLKFKDALDALAEKGERAQIVFAPDIVRDVGLTEPAGKNLVLELSGRGRERVRGYTTFVRGGGHAMLGANAAIALRGLLTEAADVSILAKVYPKDRQELVMQYLVNNPAERGIAPVNTEFVLNDRTKLRKQAGNVLLGRGRHTTIFPGEQPEFRLDDYSEEQKRKVLGLLNSADVVAVLSLKSDFMKDVLGLCEKGKLRIPELFCDCTSGDEMGLNYRMLNILLGEGGSSTIGLLSINEDEATLFEMLLVRTDEREIREANDKKKGLIIELDEAIKDGSTEREAGVRAKIGEVDEFLNKGRKKKEDAYSAARVLHERTGVPLLMHTKEGACIIGGNKSTGFVPSVDITFPDDCSLVGAGDTLCGAFAIALAVKRRSDALIPEDKKSRRLSYEDCLLIANIATGYRLAKINRADKDDAREMEWYEAVGKVGELYGWASAKTAKRSAEAALPGVEFIDVEKNSDAFGDFSEMDSEILLEKVRNNCETDYWTARVAFEELCRNLKHMDALVELVTDSGQAGRIFGKKAVHVLAERRKAGVDALVEAISSMDEEPAFKVVSESVMTLKNAEVTAEIIFRVLCTGRLADSFEKLMEQVTSKNFGRHVDIAMNRLARRPFFIRSEFFGDAEVIGGLQGRLSAENKNLDLVYGLSMFAQRAWLALDKNAAGIVSSLPIRDVSYTRWEEFENEAKDICEKSTISGLLGKEAPGVREKLMKKYNLSNEDLNNAIVRLLHTKHFWDWSWPSSMARGVHKQLWNALPRQLKKRCIEMAPAEPQHKLLSLLAPPYTEAVRDFVLWYSERWMRVESCNLPVPDRLVENFTVDGTVRDFYRKVLAICLIGQVITPRLTPPYDQKGYSTYNAPRSFYRGRVEDLRRMMSQWSGEQPQAEAAKRAARECSRIERDHFMKPMRPKRRFEAARPERMKRIV